jgi:hypothetical protein
MQRSEGETQGQGVGARRGPCRHSILKERSAMLASGVHFLESVTGLTFHTLVPLSW